MSSIFGDLDLEGVSADPFKVNGGTYLSTLQEPKVKPGKDGKGLALNFKIKECEDNPQMVGRSVSEWKTIPQPADPKNPTEDEQKAASWLKQRLVSIGVTDFGAGLEAQLKEAAGKDFIVTVVENGDYTNIRKVVAASSGPTALEGNPFKKK